MALAQLFLNEDIIEVVVKHMGNPPGSKYNADYEYEYPPGSKYNADYEYELRCAFSWLPIISDVNKGFRNAATSRLSTLTKMYISTERCEVCDRDNIVSVNEVFEYCRNCRYGTFCMCTSCRRSGEELFCDVCWAIKDSSI